MFVKIIVSISNYFTLFSNEVIYIQLISSKVSSYRIEIIYTPLIITYPLAYFILGYLGSYFH